MRGELCNDSETEEGGSEGNGMIKVHIKGMLQSATCRWITLNNHRHLFMFSKQKDL